MSLAVYKTKDGNILPFRPRGGLLKGWLPGTIVNPVYSGSPYYMDVVLASENPTHAGNGGMFTMHGSYEFKSGFDRRFPNQNESSGLWTPDEMLQWTKGEENLVYEYDNAGLLSKEGKDITTVNVDGGGCYKIYTFERYDNAYLNSNGASGGEIDWKSHIGELAGTSPRSLFTTIDNTIINECAGFRIGNYAKDERGWFIFLIGR